MVRGARPRNKLASSEHSPITNRNPVKASSCKDRFISRPTNPRLMVTIYNGSDLEQPIVFLIYMLFAITSNFYKTPGPKKQLCKSVLL
jgi:hypothetical protein